MRAAALAPDEATYGALLTACGKVGDAAAAERLFAEMCAAGVPQGVLTYTPLMHANVTCNTPESLARVFQARPASHCKSVCKRRAEDNGSPQCYAHLPIYSHICLVTTCNYIPRDVRNHMRQGRAASRAD